LWDRTGAPVAVVAASDSAGSSTFTIARRDGVRSQIRRLGPLMGHYGPARTLTFVHSVHILKT
jgi:hypothetical protein